MRFLVFGAGALGSLVGGLLAQEHDVTLVGRRAHVEAIRKNGLEISGRTELVVRPEAMERLPADAPPEIVLVTVKAYDTPKAIRELKAYWKESTFLSLQNGLGNEEILAKRAEKVLGGVTGQGVTFVGPGKVFHAGTGETFIGPVKGVRLDQGRELVESFTQCGMPCHLTENIGAELWLKAIVNACINPLTGLLGVPNGALSTSEHIGEIVRRVVMEGTEVAGSEGIDLDAERVLQRVWAIAESTAENKSSMLQDLERGRRTEIDAINGAIVEFGRTHRIACPFNATLALLVRAKEKTPRLRL